jgi:hypothetical protein
MWSEFAERSTFPKRQSSRRCFKGLFIHQQKSNDSTKAWAALVTTFIMPYLAQYGIGPDTTVEEFLVVVGGAAISALIVYFVPNKPVIE